jgi:hypothetical protein
MSKQTIENNNHKSAQTRGTEKSLKTTKSAQILKLLCRKNGACLAEIQTATGWQAHSVRGFLSGALKKRMGLEIVSMKDAKGVRRYRIAD